MKRFLFVLLLACAVAGVAAAQTGPAVTSVPAPIIQMPIGDSPAPVQFGQLQSKVSVPPDDMSRPFVWATSPFTSGISAPPPGAAMSYYIPCCRDPVYSTQGGSPLATSVATSSGSTLTFQTETIPTNIAVGAMVTGTNIPGGTFVVSWVSNATTSPMGYATTVTLSQAVTAPGVASGATVLFFSSSPLSLTTNAATTSGATLQVPGTAGIPLGSLVAGSNIPPFSFVASTASTSITLSQNIASTVASGSALTIIPPVSLQTSQIAASGTSKLYFSSAAWPPGVFVGAAVYAPGIPPGTLIQALTPGNTSDPGNVITLTQAITSSIASGSSIEFVSTISDVTSASTSSGSTLPFPATTGITVGASVSGTHIAPNTYVQSVTSTSVTLTHPILGVVASGAPLLFNLTPLHNYAWYLTFHPDWLMYTVASPYAATTLTSSCSPSTCSSGTILTVASPAGIAVGNLVTSPTSGLATGSLTVVTGVSGNNVTISPAIVGTISTSQTLLFQRPPLGSTTATSTCTSMTCSNGTVIPVASTVGITVGSVLTTSSGFSTSRATTVTAVNGNNLTISPALAGTVSASQSITFQYVDGATTLASGCTTTSCNNGTVLPVSNPAGINVGDAVTSFPSTGSASGLSIAALTFVTAVSGNDITVSPAIVGSIGTSQKLYFWTAIQDRPQDFIFDLNIDNPAARQYIFGNLLQSGFQARHNYAAIDNLSTSNPTVSFDLSDITSLGLSGLVVTGPIRGYYVGAVPGCSAGPPACGGVWTQLYTGAEEDPAFFSDHLAYLQWLRAQVNLAGFGLAGNVKVDKNNLGGDIQLAQNTDLDVMESPFLRACYPPAVTTDPVTEFQDQTDGQWATEIEVAAAVGSLRPLYQIGYLCGTSASVPSTDPNSITQPEISWGLGNYLLTLNPQASPQMMMSTNNVSKIQGAVDAGSYFSYPASMSRSIGLPTGTGAVTPSPSLATIAAPAPGGPCYTRGFTFGMVAVWPYTTNSCTFSVGSSGQTWIDNNLTAIASLTYVSCTGAGPWTCVLGPDNSQSGLGIVRANAVILLRCTPGGNSSITPPGCPTSNAEADTRRAGPKRNH